MIEILSRTLWKKYLSEDEELLWCGYDSKGSATCWLSVVFAFMFTILLTVNITRNFKNIEPWKVTLTIGLFSLAAEIFYNISFFRKLSYYSVTNKRIMEYHESELTEIKYSDVDYMGMGGMKRHFQNLDRIMHEMKAEGYDINPPKLPDLSVFPECFTVAAGDTEIYFYIKDSSELKKIIEGYVSPEVYGS